jgi:hypothetical protein
MALRHFQVCPALCSQIGTLISSLLFFPSLSRDISTSLVQMKIWQQNRKLKATAVAVRSTVAFTKAGARFRRGLLKSAQEAKQLEDAGIDWKLSSAEIKSELEKKTVISSKKYLAVTDHSQLTYSASMSENQEKECSLNSA